MTVMVMTEPCPQSCYAFAVINQWSVASLWASTFAFVESVASLWASTFAFAESNLWFVPGTATLTFAFVFAR